MRPPLHHRLQARAQRQRGLAGAGAAAERDDADVGVEQQVERDALLGRAPVQAERLAVAAHQPHLLVRRHPAQRRPARGEQHQPGVRRHLRRGRDERLAVAVQLVELGVVQRHLRHPGPAGVDGVGHPVLVGVQADRGRLDPQRHVLGDQADVAALGAQVERHDQDPAVVACRCGSRPAAPTGRCG